MTIPPSLYFKHKIPGEDSKTRSTWFHQQDYKLKAAGTSKKKISLETLHYLQLNDRADASILGSHVCHEVVWVIQKLERKSSLMTDY